MADARPADTGLPAFLRERQADILAAWKNEVRARAPSPEVRELPGPALRDHLPQLLDRLADEVEAEVRGLPGDPVPEAERHALDRLGQGFAIGDLVAEYAVLREVILRLWDPYAHPGDGQAALHRVLDGFLTSAATAHAREREEAARIEQGLRRDVEEQRAAATESWRRLQTMLDVLPVGVFVADAFGRILATNDAARRIWGVAAPLLIGPERYAEYEAYRADGGERLRADEWGLARVFATGEPTLGQELDIVAFDGTRRSIVNSAVPIRDDAGRITGGIAVNLDVTERRREERDRTFLADVGRALSESLDYETTLRRLAELAVPRIADWCAIDVVEEGVVRRVALADVKPDRTSRSAEFLRRFPPNLEETYGSGRVIRTGEPYLLADVTPERLRAIAHDEAHHAALIALGIRSWMAVPLVARGRNLGAVLFASGSDRRFGERDLALARQLAERAALAVDNARLYRDAREAIRARDDLWAVAAHELKNPLAALLLLLQSARRALERGQAAPLDKLESAEKQVRRLSDLVGDLLDSTRAQAGRLEIRREETDLAALAEEVVERHRPEARLAGTSIAFSATDHPRGRWDPGRLEQVLVNLLGNALKYGQGAPVSVTVGRADGVATLAVDDRGPGIPLEEQGRIFEPFERAAEARRKQGLGLGLYIVRRIVEAHGGRIDLCSAPGAGATFTVTLPLEG